MSTWTPATTPTVEDNVIGQAAYEHLIDQGVAPLRAGQTLEFECEGCSIKTWTSLAGGALNPCACKDGPQAHRMHVHTMFAGEREYMGTMGDIVRR